MLKNPTIATLSNTGAKAAAASARARQCAGVQSVTKVMNKR